MITLMTGDRRHPGGLPGDPACSSTPSPRSPTGLPAATTTTRPRRRRVVRLRVHRRRDAGGHGGIRRPHRRDVPAPRGDGPLPAGALSGSDPRRARRSSCPWWQSDSPSSAPYASSPPRRSSITTGSACRQRLSRPALDNWAADHAHEVICNFNYNGPNVPPSIPCGNGQTSGPPPGATIKTPRGVVTVPSNYTEAQIRAFAVTMAKQDYSDYARTSCTRPIPS